MCIITIRGQLGSGATEIGKLVADKLQIDYVDKDVIAKVAAQLRRSEHQIAAKEMPPGTLSGRIMEVLERSGWVDGIYVPEWDPPVDDGSYIEGLKSVVQELARGKSLVIRGRGSQFILRDYPDVFHVLVVSPLPLRIKRVMEGLQIDEEAAKKEIMLFDSSRREFTRRYFKADLEDPVNYDLVINTQRIIFEDAASIIASICSQYFHFRF